MTEPTKTLTSRDWTPLFSAFAEALAWVLDRARDFARAYPDEVAAVERVRTFVQKRIAGDPAHVRVDDLLFTLGLVAGAIEHSRAMRSGSHVQRTDERTHLQAVAELHAVPMHVVPEPAVAMQRTAEVVVPVQRTAEVVVPVQRTAEVVVQRAAEPVIAHSPQSRVVRMSRRQQPRLEMSRRDVRPVKSSRKEFVRV